MQIQIHLCDCGCGEVVFLTKNPAVCQTVAAHMMNGFDEHSTRAACGIIYSFSGLGVQKVHHEFDDWSRRIEFTGVLFRQVRELLYQIFVAVAHDVGGIVSVAHPNERHMLHKILQPLVRQLILVSPCGVVKGAENARQGIRICFFNSSHSLYDGFSYILADAAHIFPMTALRDNEEIHTLPLSVFHIAAGELHSFRILLVINVRDTFEKEDRRHIALIFILIDGTAQNVAGVK